MATEGEGSVSRWIGDLAGGGDTEAAAQQLWERYFERLVNLARARLRAASRGPADEEDAALARSTASAKAPPRAVTRGSATGTTSGGCSWPSRPQGPRPD